jgi:hypothetical protein
MRPAPLPEPVVVLALPQLLPSQAGLGPPLPERMPWALLPVSFVGLHDSVQLQLPGGDSKLRPAFEASKLEKLAIKPDANALSSKSLVSFKIFWQPILPSKMRPAPTAGGGRQ